VFDTEPLDYRQQGETSMAQIRFTRECNANINFDLLHLIRLGLVVESFWFEAHFSNERA
jgi:hypothetical protein